MTQPVDSGILHEIVRIVDSRSKVPDRVRLRGREYQITYLEDHKQRLEEALRRRDGDRINMLYGQLASKVKYQVLRTGAGAQSSAARKGRDRAAAKKATSAAKHRPLAKKSVPAKKHRPVGKKVVAAKRSSRAARK